MRRFLAMVAAAVWIAMGATIAKGQDSGSKPASATVMSGTARPAPTIDELSIPGKTVTVGKFLPLIKQKLPSFQYVAKEGHWQDFVLPQLSLQNVTAMQVVELLRYLVPQFEAEVPASPDSTTQVWLFRDRPVQTGFGNEVRLVAYGLNEPVDRLALRKAWSIAAGNSIAPTPEQIATSRKEALKEILSLLEAALGQAAEPGPEPSLKLHAETGVLLVKGSAAQLSAISQALEALKSGDDLNQYSAVMQQIRGLRHDIEVLKAGGSLPTTMPGNPNAGEKH